MIDNVFAVSPQEPRSPGLKVTIQEHFDSDASSLVSASPIKVRPEASPGKRLWNVNRRLQF